MVVPDPLMVPPLQVMALVIVKLAVPLSVPPDMVSVVVLRSALMVSVPAEKVLVPVPVIAALVLKV